MAGKSLFTAQAGGLGVEQQRQLVNEAKEQGVEVSPGQELSSLSTGFGIGQLERLPIERLFGGISKNLDEGLQLSIVDKVRRAAQTGGVEGAQEVGSSLLQELTPKVYIIQIKKLVDQCSMSSDRGWSQGNSWRNRLFIRQ